MRLFLFGFFFADFIMTAIGSTKIRYAATGISGTKLRYFRLFSNFAVTKFVGSSGSINISSVEPSAGAGSSESDIIPS